MRLLVKLILALVVVGAAAATAYPYARTYWKERNKPLYREAAVVRGGIVAVVNSTGTIQPVLRVQVGTFVSGPIRRLCADYNDDVTKGQLLAQIDPRIYQAAVARDTAGLATREADVKRIEALLQQAMNDEKRASELIEEHEDFISDTEMDQLKYNRISLQAQIDVAKATVAQAKASLAVSQLNLDYTNITSPVDGVVIDRKIDEGQTLAAQFQTPELFVVAPDMRARMHVFASVDEADIGQIREAQRAGQPVKFRVDAYPDDLFEGKIHEIRVNPTTTQNVVTYPVVVEAPNPDLKLLPGMTANISFQIDQCDDVLKIPNSVLRYYPKPEQVRPEDRKLLDGADDDSVAAEQSDAASGQSSAMEAVDANRKRNRRHVWMVEGEFLRAVEIVTGLSDYRFTQLISGDLKEGQKLVAGLKRRHVAEHRRLVHFSAGKLVWQESVGRKHGPVPSASTR